MGSEPSAATAAVSTGVSDHRPTPEPRDRSAKRPRLTVIVPMFNESENIGVLVQRMRDLGAAFPQAALDFVVVDDGSSDDSVPLLQRLGAGLPIHLVKLSRNFGSHAALSAGFEVATGDAVAFMGADGQEPVDLFVEMYGRWQAGNDVVWAIRTERATGGRLGKAAARMFWRLLHRFSGVKNYPPEGPSIFLVDQEVVRAVNRLHERNRSILLLIAWVGFRTDVVSFVQLERTGGTSKWTTRKLIKQAVDSLVQFSQAPIRAASYSGFVLAFLGFLYALFQVVRVVFGNVGPEGWATVVVIVLVVSGAQLITIGILGEYLWRGTDESRQRPLYIVDSRVTMESDPPR